MVDKNNKIADKNNKNLKINGTDKPKKNGTKFGEFFIENLYKYFCFVKIRKKPTILEKKFRILSHLIYNFMNENGSQSSTSMTA